jgi:4-methylaminobutanoate oxidase (formaldehyde-forming)
MLSFVATSANTPLAHGGELILRQGKPAGEITSAAYGHTVGGVVALGYVATGGDKVDAKFLEGPFELDIAGERVPVRASLKAPYDPANARVKA